MNRVRNRLNYALYITGVVLCLLASNEINAQEENHVIYKFSVDGIENRADAKILLHAFLQESVTVNSVFIEECKCFKLTANRRLVYSDIEKTVMHYGLSLSNEVLCSDGSALHKPIDKPPIRK
jgi:hypothetical protein